MGDSGSSAEPTAEAVELSAVMLGIIGAYGVQATRDIGDSFLEGDSQPPMPERALASADDDTNEGVWPRATG